METISARVRAICFLASMLAPALAHAQTARPKLELARILDEIAVRSAIAIIYQPKDLKGRVASPVAPASVESMLRQALFATDLVYRFTGPRTVVVERVRRSRVKPPAMPTGNTADIVVTALRRPTLLGETPASVRALPGYELERRAVTNMAGLASLDPELRVATLGPGYQRLSLRGIYSPGEPVVGLYVGDVALVGPGGSNADPGLMTPDLVLADVDRIEILKGPQGTLYGSGALAGAVRILFREVDPGRPSARVTSSLATVAGGGMALGGTAMLNMPLSGETLGLRVVAYQDSSPGYLDNKALGLRDVNARKRTGGRVMLRWSPLSDWRLRLSVLGQKSTVPDSSAVSLDGADSESTNAKVRERFSDRFVLTQAQLDGKLGGAEMNLALAHTRWAVNRRLDTTALLLSHQGDTIACAAYFRSQPCSQTDLAAFDRYVVGQTPSMVQQPLIVETRSAELRFSGGSSLQWTAGAIYNARSDSGSSTVRPSISASGLPDPDRLPTGARRFRTSIRQTALYADGSWTLGGQWAVSAGARHFGYDRRARGNVLIPNLISGPFEASSFTDRYHAAGTVGRFQVALSPRTGTRFYAQVASGFRPGGINVAPRLAQGLAAYGDDRVISYEMGASYLFPSTGLRVTSTAYRQRWTDMQYSVTSPDRSYSFITNIGSARVLGADVGVKWSLLPGVTISANAAYTRASIASIRKHAAVFFDGKAGDAVPFIPRFSFDGSIAVSQPLDADVILDADLQANFVGPSPGAFGDQARRLTMGNIGTLNAHIELRRGGTAITLNIENLTGSRGREWVYSALASDQAILQRPTSFVLGLRHER